MDTGGRGVLNATGLGGAFVFVLLIIIFRGGKKLVIEGLDGNQGQNEVDGSLDNRFSEAYWNQEMAKWTQKESKLNEILALQKQHGLSDDDLDAVLMEIWKSQNPGERSGPWQFRIGNMDWRLTVDWDVERVKQRIEARAIEGSGTEFKTTAVVENNDSE